MVKQAVKVVIRTRPTADFASKNLQIDPAKGTITIKMDKREEDGIVNNQTDSWKFQFEKILHNASQDETYESCAADIIDSVVEGYNGTVLCYGQTGAGKTYSMTGNSTEFKYRGIVPRAINQIYAATSAKFDQAITIRVSYAQIYNEKIQDLLLSSPEQMSSQNLTIQDDQRGGVHVVGLGHQVCDSEEEALNCLFEGEMNRTIGAHSQNAVSSRSHTIYTLHIESRSRVESADKVVFSKLHLVDLAGSERTKKTGSTGKTLQEAQLINKSLTFLEQVVLALCDRKREHIPYRQATLTNFLRDSLGGNCKTVMIANIRPELSHLQETNSTLKFATRMMKVSNEATVNLVLNPALQIKRYEKEIKDLKQELAMHDTLANRGRINYAQYSQSEQADIQQITNGYLNGDRDDIGDIDSLRKVREVFACIRTQYRKTQQNIEAIKRQLETNPDAFKDIIKKQEEEAATKKDVSEEQKDADKLLDKLEDEGDAQESTPKSSKHAKRQAIDKQDAFVEFKESEEGLTLESHIHEHRSVVREKRSQIKNLTADLNTAKTKIDALKAKLDRKEQERKLRLREEQLRQDDAFEEAVEEIIDEEELVMLREMKDLKKSYRDSFTLLKGCKSEYSDAQTQIDLVKERLITNFEVWYANEFDHPESTMENVYNQNLQFEMKGTSNNDAMFGVSTGDEDEAQTFMRAKRQVEVLHKARKMDRVGGKR